MTDYTDLIARLRGNDMPWSVKDAADALEAQAGRIVELEEGLKLERDTGTRLWEGALAYMKERNEARARIAELTAALEERHRHHLKLELRCRELEAEKQSFRDRNKQND
jgi:hypothetical protein